MRFMVLVKANADSEAGAKPSETMLEAMGKYLRELAEAGVLLDGAGLKPSSKGARIRFSGKTTSVIDGPFAEAKESIAGYHVIEVKSKEEAIAWTRRMPNPMQGEGEVEIRQLYELDEFGPSEAVETQLRDILGR
jgi:hypothetical protein